ncbi:MAG: hypothetical protein PHX21_06590 [bacterium]|nr:hypothetical protein [bacterium]
MEEIQRNKNFSEFSKRTNVLEGRGYNMKRFFGIVALVLPMALQAAITVKVLPNPAIIHPKDVVQFKAEVTDSMGNPVEAKIKWDVKPNQLGKIGPNGLFFAGGKEGKGIVRALVETAAGKGIGHSLIKISRENERRELKVRVIPTRTFAKIGDPVQFKVEVLDNDGKTVEVFKTLWKLAPPHMGKLSQDGIFTGDENGKAKIIALVKAGDLEGIGEATVMVGEPGKYLPVKIKPPHAILKPQETMKFEYEIMGPHNDSITAKALWKVIPENLGTITSDGVFTAGEKKGKGFIAVVVKAGDMTGGDRAGIIIGKPEKVKVKIYPKFSSIEPMGTIQFNAEVYDINGNLVQVPIKWEVRPEKAGTINSDGLFTAGPEIGKCEVLAIVPPEFGMGLDRAGVLIAKDMQFNVKIEPRNVNVKPGEQIQFKAVVTDLKGNIQNIPLIWEVGPNTLGTITKDGLFTAGKLPGRGIVAAIIPPNFGKGKDVAEITVASYIVKIDPKLVKVKVGATQQFDAKVVDANNNAVPNIPLMWKVFPEKAGTVTQNGLFTAGNVPCKCAVLVDIKPGYGFGRTGADVDIIQ